MKFNDKKFALYLYYTYLYIYKYKYSLKTVVMKAVVRKVVVGIFNRYSNQVEMALLGENKRIYNTHGEEVCEQDYFIDAERMSVMYNLNFKKS